MALEGVILGMYYSTSFKNQGLGQGIPIYLIIFILAQVFQIVMAWDAIRFQNTIQIIGFILFNLCCLVYSAFQLSQLRDSIYSQVQPSTQGIGSSDANANVNPDVLYARVRGYLIAVSTVIAACELLYIYLGGRLYQEFGWRIYKQIGADPEIRTMFRWYQIFLLLLKLDLFFLLSFSIQFLVLILHAGDVEFPLTVIALPVTCLVLLLAVYAVRHESRQLMFAFFCGLALGVAYFIFKLYRIYDPTQYAKYRYTKDFLTLCASISLVLLALTGLNGVRCYSNFDRGLKSHLLRDAPAVVYTNNANDRSLVLD
ncbi:hypothetical protein BZG36_03904 [Bifiguratus adelaidae]|uniref:Uncharacterized protein n=1 Tax=Bifiguratus adelaidae TaxID=1938954 RepID=A0A261XXK4_9FUNG|nr:hypothetical protein BZG36_03904 [Bifiguratus adelaidae]